MRTIRIIIAGLSNSGKTTIFNKLIGEEMGCSVPTIGYNFGQETIGDTQYIFFDIGGNADKVLFMWKILEHSFDGIIWIIDSNEEFQNMRQSRECLQQIIATEQYQTKPCPILLLANKYDVPKISFTDIKKCFTLEQPIQYIILKCVGTNKVGWNEGFEWLRSVTN